MLIVLSFLPLMVTMLTGIFTFRKLPQPFKWLLLQIILSFSVQVLCYYLVWHVPIEKANNTWVYNIYLLPDFWMQILVAILLLRRRSYTIIIMTACSIHLVVWVINIYHTGWQQLVNRAYLVANIILMASYLLLIVQLVSKEEEPLTRNPVFFLCVSVILYSCCSIPFLAMFNYLSRYHSDLFSKLFTILEVLDAIRLLICGWCFILCFRSPAIASNNSSC